MNSSNSETGDFLIATAAAHGHRVTPVMLKKWRASGLLPHGRQRGLGQPGKLDTGQKRGSDTLYPPGTVRQLLRLLEVRAEGGRFKPEQALWRLWWEGFPIEPGRIRSLLLEYVEAFAAWCIRWSSSTEDQRIEEIGRLSHLSPSRLPGSLRVVRMRVDERGMEQLTSVLMRTAAGDFSARVEPGARDALLSGLGLDQARHDRIGNVPPWLRGVLDKQLHRLGMTIRPEQLHEAVTLSADDELCLAREELQACLGFLYSVRLTLDSVTGRDGAFGLGLFSHPDEIDHDIMPSILLGWLAFRRDPELSAGFSTLMTFAESGAPREFFVSLIRNDHNEVLPRRLAPSGSVTHGEDPSTCERTVSRIART